MIRVHWHICNLVLANSPTAANRYETGCYFHRASRTQKQCLKWPVTVEGPRLVLMIQFGGDASLGFSVWKGSHITASVHFKHNRVSYLHYPFIACLLAKLFALLSCSGNSILSVFHHRSDSVLWPLPWKAL